MTMKLLEQSKERMCWKKAEIVKGVFEQCFSDSFEAVKQLLGNQIVSVLIC